MKRFNKLFTSLMIIIAASASYGQNTTQGGVRIDGAHTAGNMVVFGDGGRSLVDVGVGFTEVTNAVNLAASAVQPYTDGDLELTASGFDATVWGDAVINSQDLSGPRSTLGLLRDHFLLESLGGYKEARIIATNGTLVLEWKGGVADSLHRHEFGAVTNYFSTPVTVGNATNSVQALNQTVADGLYVQPHTDGDLELTASGTGFIYGGTNNYGGVSLKEEQAVLFTVFDNPDPDFPFDQYSGVYVDSDGNIKLYWPYEVVPGSWGIKEHVFGALTNSFSTPVTVGNATNETQALNQTVADGLYVQPDDLVSARSTIIGLLNNMDAEVITVLQGDAAGIVFYRVGYDGTHYVYDDRNVDLDGRGNRRIYYSDGYWYQDRVGSYGGSIQRCLWHEMGLEPKTPPISGWESVNFSLGPDPIITPIPGAFLAKSYRWSADIDALGSAAYASTNDFAPASITNDLGVVAGDTEANRLLIDELASATSTVAESVVNLTYVVNPSLWGLSINGDLEPMGVSAGLLDDGLFAIDLSTGDLMITGNQSTRFWQVSGSDIYPEVN